jgi:hypothetical protein
MAKVDFPVNYTTIPCASPLVLRALRPCSRALLDLVRALCHKGACWASLAWFTEQLGYCRRSICYAIAELVKAGLLLRTERHTGTGKQRTSTCVVPRAPRSIVASRGATQCTQLLDTSGNLEITRSASRSPVEPEETIPPHEQTLLDEVVARSGAPAPRAKQRAIALLLHFLGKGEQLDALCEQARAYYQRAESLGAWTVPLVTWLASTRLYWRDYSQKVRPWWASSCPRVLDWRRCDVQISHEERFDARRPWRIVCVESSQWTDAPLVVESSANRTRFVYRAASARLDAPRVLDTPSATSHSTPPPASIWSCSRVELCERLEQLEALGSDLAFELRAMCDNEVDLSMRRAIAATLAARAGFDDAEIDKGLVVSFLPTWRPEFAAVWGGEYAAHP